MTEIGEAHKEKEDVSFDETGSSKQIEISVISSIQPRASIGSEKNRKIDTSSEEYSDGGESSKSHPSTPPPPKDWFGCRHVFALMGCLGLATVYMMRINLSVAIVDMVKTESSSRIQDQTSFFGSLISYQDTRATTNDSLQCEDNSESGGQNNGEFDWDSETQGLVLGAFYWGYIITQVPGGLVAEKYGGKYVFGTGVLLAAIFNLFTPLAARSGGSSAMIAIRMLTGMAEGVTFPTANGMVAKWVPTFEKTTIGAFVLVGTQLGTMISFPLSGWLCNLDLEGGGWPLAFYVPGVIGIIWLVAWIFLVYNNPQVHPRIKEDEKLYILASTGTAKQRTFKQTPWLSFVTSIHLWAILIAHFGHSWGLTMLLTELPTYMSSVLHFDLKANGLLSALPYFAMWLFSMGFSVTADTLRKKKIFSTTVTRKIFSVIGLLLPACGLVGASYTGCNRVATLTLLTFSCGFNGAVYSGFLANHIDIASNYAGTMMGITNCLASVTGIIAPIVVGAIVYTPGSLSQWQTVFFLSGGIYASTCLFYVIFGTGVEQEWNKIVPENSEAEIIPTEQNEEKLTHP